MKSIVATVLVGVIGLVASSDHVDSSMTSFLSGPYTDDVLDQYLMKTRTICSKDDSIEAACLKESHPEIYNHSKAALRITNEGRAWCTGFLIGDEGHILTNHHCIQTQWGTNLMGFEAMAEGKTCKSRCRRALACKGEVIHSDKLMWLYTGGNIAEDFTLVQLPESDRARIVKKFGYLKLRVSGPVVGESIYIPQHPRGFGKQIAMHDGKNNDATVISTNTTDFNRCGKRQVEYRADTQGGSSGSPVIATKDNAVVGIHHCGGCSSKYGNTAVHVDRLVRALRKFLPKTAFLE